MNISYSLMYYKKPEVQRAIVREAQDKECSVRYINEGFGKRPDILSYESDIIELAKKKATSFHCSEELWYNPLSISTGMKKNELDSIRKGWDLILDIDCPDWEISKLTTHLFIQALKDHNIKAIFCKFSGNKGFHIAVPFECFPKNIKMNNNIIEFKNYFPDGARKIALYLLSYITENYAKIKTEGVSFLDKYLISFDKLDKLAKQNSRSTIAYQCKSCKTIYEEIPKNKKIIYQCSKCGQISNPKKQLDIIRCEDCDFPVERKVISSACSKCMSDLGFDKIFNFFAVVEVDTILIASRHLYRMPYSLHEKSGLVSIPINIDDVLSFEKEMANPEKITYDKLFINRNKAMMDEASNLIKKAFEFSFEKESEKNKNNFDSTNFNSNEGSEVVLPEIPLQKEFFPPCINKIFDGLQDGKKRALFILINFFRSIGWQYEQIEKEIYLWNQKNPEPLREQYLKGQLIQIKKNKKIVLPPNCSNKDYYKSLMICQKDDFCPFIKNPAHYSKSKYEKKSPSKSKKTKDYIKTTNDLLIVNENNNIIGKKSKEQINSNTDILRACALWVENSAEGILLAKYKTKNSFEWKLPVFFFEEEETFSEKKLKKEATNQIGLRTFVIREGEVIFIKDTKNKENTKCSFFCKIYKTLVDRNTNLFKFNIDTISEFKWFSKNQLEKEIKENKDDYNILIREIMKTK
jgi:hypothetical protein